MGRRNELSVVRGVRSGLSTARVIEYPDNSPRQRLLDFAVPRNGLSKPSRRVPVPVVLGAMPHQHAPESWIARIRSTRFMG